MGCGSGLQRRSFNFAAASRSRSSLYGNLVFPDKRINILASCNGQMIPFRMVDLR